VDDVAEVNAMDTKRSRAFRHRDAAWLDLRFVIRYAHMVIMNHYMIHANVIFEFF
jgi:hypothetical protein